MAAELLLKSACDKCGVTVDLYGSECHHLTLCPACGKAMAEARTPCTDCSLPVLRLVREFTVRAHQINKQYFIGRFLQGVPSFSKKKGAESRWCMQREGLQGRQLTEALKEKYKTKPWILEDDNGQQQFQGQLEGGQQASYYLLMTHGKDFLAMPAGAWYNFHKLVQYKQLTLEEAEEQMKNRRRTADGYQRWMMKAASTGAAAFGEVEKIGAGLGGRRKDEDHDLDEDSDRGEEDEDEEEARKNRLGMNKGTKGGDEDGDDPARGEDMEFDDDDAEKGDDWEHEETFTDDDEAVGNDPEEREDQVLEVPAPPEIKQEEEEEEEGEENQQEEGGGLSKSGRELKKLLGKSTGLDDSDADEDEEEDEDVDLDNEDIGLSPVFAPKRQDAPKDEPSETPVKAAVAGNGKSTQVSASAKAKRKAPTEEKVNGSAKKIKLESSREVSKGQTVTPVKKESAATTSPAKAAPASSAKAPAPVTKTGTQASTGVTEEEVKKVLQQTGPMKSQDLVARFKSRLRAPEDRNTFAVILKKISRIQKKDGINYIVLRDKA